MVLDELKLELRSLRKNIMNDSKTGEVAQESLLKSFQTTSKSLEVSVSRSNQMFLDLTKALDAALNSDNVFTDSEVLKLAQQCRGVNERLEREVSTLNNLHVHSHETLSDAKIQITNQKWKEHKSVKPYVQDHRNKVGELKSAARR